jgi:hypothetical protein
MRPLLATTVMAVSMFGSIAFAQTQAAGVPVHMLVTAEPVQGSAVPAISRGDVAVWQGRTRLPVTEWLPLQGDQAGLELYILIDERVDPNQAALFEQLRRFISDQPPSTAVGIAYMFNGEAHIARTPTQDHKLAAEALRVSSGSESAAASPFMSLSALVHGWSSGAPRREVLAVTDGIDRFGDFGDLNMYVGQTVADVQRAGVVVFCLYAPSLGHAAHSSALIRWGQTYLGQVAEETGGEAYLSGSIDLFLADLNKHLAHQYQVTFLAPPTTGAGFQAVRFTTGVPNVDLLSAYGFYGHAPSE